MLKSSGFSIFAILLATVAILAALDPASAKQKKKKIKASAALGAYGVDIRQTSVSGVSAGGAMAVQMHIAHSSIMRGVGVIAGVTYDCANSALPLPSLSLALLGLCMDGSTDYTKVSITRTTDAAKNGFID